MNRSLAARLGRVETDAHERWLATPQARSPEEWSRRFAAHDPRNAELLRLAEPLAAAQAPGLLRGDPPRLQADHAVTVLLQAGMPLYLHYRKLGRGPMPGDDIPDDQLEALLRGAELLRRIREYQARTGDMHPWGRYAPRGLAVRGPVRGPVRGRRRRWS